MARLFIVSNRVAIPSDHNANRAGGLAVAVRPLFKKHQGVWFGWSGKVTPPNEMETRTIEHGGQSYIVTDLSEEDYQEYYYGYANRVLWPILHYRPDLADFSRRDLGGYLRVNQHFADELHKLLQPDDIVWVHDYHLLPLARALRDRGHRNKIGFFLHIPLPPPELLTALPHHERIIPDLCNYDLLGFQTERDADNFARYMEDESGITGQNNRVFATPQRVVRTGAFPVGIDVGEFNRLARRAVRSDFAQQALNSLPGPMLIGVDRLDYSKGIALRMDAFERFLSAYPQWRNKVTLLQVTPKSRSEIREYAEMEQHICEAISRVNGAYGDVSWTPIRYLNRSYSRTALAGLYRGARVGLVTPLRDGMNLVAKEYMAAQDAEDPGVLILSRFAGAAEEMDAAVLVNPYDPEAVAAAIAQALSMPLEERRARYNALLQVLERNDIDPWYDRFMRELSRPAKSPVRTAAIHDQPHSEISIN